MSIEMIPTPTQRAIRELRRAAATGQGHAVLEAAEAAEVMGVLVELDRSLNTSELDEGQQAAAARSIVRTALWSYPEGDSTYDPH